METDEIMLNIVRSIKKVEMGNVVERDFVQLSCGFCAFSPEVHVNCPGLFLTHPGILCSSHKLLWASLNSQYFKYINESSNTVLQ